MPQFLVESCAVKSASVFGIDRAARRAVLQFERIVQAVNDLSDKRREIEDA